ncbi:metal-dependent hydrolase [Alkalimarinus coralli]|uniref:metal-dependent hydrolase n=1 Tax=Alkalimarinus coralli TaxID=2935863 RepID=UPI00202B7C02|nr:metal-dependent hydrolase [Alkalimarinus coralli]
MNAPTPSVNQVSQTDTALLQRKVSFDFSASPLHWIPNDPYTSHFISVIHTILPAGEFFFCRLYNKALPYIDDEKLKQDVKGFIKQEAMHAKAHTGGISNFLENQEMEVGSFIKQVEWLFDSVLHDKPFGRKVPKQLERDWLVLRLGLIAAVEHFTCVLGKYALENTQWDHEGADPTILDILRWHASEEIEHRSVAFDVYQHLGGNYPMRYLQMLIAFPVVIGLWVKGSSHLMAQDSSIASKRPKAFGVYFWREWQRKSKSGHLPSLLWLARQASRYFSPSYNPAIEASTEQAQAYLAQSPAALRAAAINAA